MSDWIFFGAQTGEIAASVLVELTLPCARRTTMSG